ncbi:hypothetical protein QBC46DRAFT_117262 [Diplogelasinospora grovesii]|uniref:Fibronectin type-III domain-containing protein n=1 Tax=Diplogelasinospora grovesii TaxID=303347 RepID=A0AAN6NII7_9PEZI|nr:hypothetical protein QBC46DRAFT_117262 [Diplogelasinospora grovesii]
MSWNSHTLLVPTLLIVSAVLAWWFTEPKNARINLIAAVGVVLFCWAVAPDRSRDFSAALFAACVGAIGALHLESWVANHATMLLTGGAVVWLLRRAWQTLWKPVPELINILGVDVPDPPDVSLAGIRPDAATVNWTRPPANRSVQKFLIQVNGVVVGEVGANQEPAIVVSGLKPDHFYNVRVIAVGSNNFQAGSRFIRLRTFSRDGRPQLGNARLPSNFMPDDPNGPGQGEHGEENGGPRGLFPALETNATPEGAASPSREGSSAAGAGPRRNTVTRRHSPSTTSMDQTPIRDEVNAHTEKTLPELTEKFESIRKETEDVVSLIAKEDVENKQLLEELEADRQQKRQQQKTKEDQTEKLRRDVNSTERTMRNAQQRRSQKEKLLKEKMNERSKYHDKIAKWEQNIEEMRKEQAAFDQQRKELEEKRDKSVEQYRDSNGDLQSECSRLETELKNRRDKVSELNEARKTLPGGEDDAVWREKETALRRDWQRKHRELSEALGKETKEARKLDDHYRILTMHLANMQVQQHMPPAAPYGLYGPANASGIETENITQLKRRSRTGNSLSNVSIPSPLPAYSQIDPALSAPPGGFASSRGMNAPPGFAPGPFMDLSADMPPRQDEAGIRASQAPLSPSATNLLPSNILDDLDDDEPSPTSRLPPDPFLAHADESPRNDAHSPASSGRSMSFLSSPHGSTHHLPFSQFSGETSDRRSYNATSTVSSPLAAEASATKRSGLFSFQRSQTAKNMESEGPALGSLKQGQSQSFPRQTDEADGAASRRRTSISGSWLNRNSAGPDMTEGHVVTSSKRSLNPFSSSSRAVGGFFVDRDASSPRPASIASSDFPRPSTDSSSIWGPPADGGGLGKQRGLWGTDNMPWSRNPSRRPSLHGSPSALKTTLASADDEILDDEALPNVNKVGVIGSRPPPQSSKPLGRLNPNAPAFIGTPFGSFFKSKGEKDSAKEKSKSDKKERAKEKAKDSKDKSKGKETAASASTTTPDTSLAPSVEVESPSDSRQSRDTLSIHTQTDTSVAESRDSLSLDISFSNTPSEPTSIGLSSSVKDSENVVRKLFRKSSSGKFSLSGRLSGKDSSFFKKGPGSTASGTNSDKGVSLERSSIGDFDEAGGDDLGLLSPSLTGARSYESATSSPGFGPTLSATSGGKGKEGNNKTPVRWLSGLGRKGKKEKESLDLDRAQISEQEGLQHE